MHSALHHSHYHLIRFTQMGRVVWAHLLDTLAFAVVMVFVPIFMLKSGYSFHQVLLFLAFQGLLSVLVEPAAAWFVGKCGANRSMIVGLVFQVAFFAELVTLLTVHWPLLLLAITWAGWRAFYWLGFHINFSKASSHKRSGTQVSVVQIIKVLGAGIAPAIGGVLATKFGINVVYGIAIGLQAAAALPLLRAPEISRRRRAAAKLLPVKKVRRDLLANMGNSTTTVAESIVWPILVFTLLPTYAAVGILSSVIALASIVTALYVARRQSVHGEHHYIREGVMMAGLSDALRLVAQNAGHVFGINFFGGVGNSLYYTPYMSRLYGHADSEPRIEYLAAMEMSHELAWGMYFLVLFALSLLLPLQAVLLVGIALAVPANFLIRLIR